MSQAVQATGRSAIFGGGPLYYGSQTEVQKELGILRLSGFTTVILWSVHVRTTGDLILNDDEIVKDGKYVGDDAKKKLWLGQLKTLKQQPTSVTRIEVSVGSWVDLRGT
jgi:hypothetical protein